MFLYLVLLPVTLILLHLLQVRRGRRLPPGPFPLPVIGNLLNLGNKPHQSLAKLAETYGPIMSLKLGQMTTIVISSPLLAQEVLQKQDISFSNRFTPDAIRACDEHKLSVVWLPVNDLWRSLRKLAHTHILSARVLDSNQHIRRRKVEELLSYVQKCCHEGVHVDIGRAAFKTAMNVLSNTLFSTDLVDFGGDEAQDFKDLVWNIMLEAGKPNMVDHFSALRGIDPQRIRRRMSLYFSKLLGLIGGLIDKKILTGTNLLREVDAIDSLLKISDLDRKLIEHLCMDIFIGGTDTSSSTIEWAMSELLRNPTSLQNAKDELERVVGAGKQVEESDIAELPYLQAVIKETLRMHPPIPFLIPRQVHKEVELSGYTIPTGAQVLVNVWAIGRNPDHWKSPMEFKPERFIDSKIDVRGQDFELVPFGGGRRVCIGLSLAMRVIPTVLGSLINSFHWKTVGGELLQPKDLDNEEKFGFTLQRANPLLVIPIPI
ncbi:geraniol 8-hydroxylase-like [Impatiens glandulifera]|uniref:geraniol 8-hydroxylase-like n=1 Tax=Impatiens glandulifera TaxID=253017 RepID=UPI001FB076CF|nr:geraniol 8-hydroxylase-like [Impatiens glandulifera]